MALGSQEGIHSAHWHGTTLLQQGMRVDAVDLLSGSMRSADLVPDAPGIWLFHCHTHHHIHGGMTALFEVLPWDAEAAKGLSYDHEPRSPANGVFVVFASQSTLAGIGVSWIVF